MYRSIADFLDTHASETAHTLGLFQAIPDTATGQLVDKGGRTLGRLAWHVTCALGEIAKNAQIGAIHPDDDQHGEIPPMKDVIATYERSAKALAGLVPTVWTDAMLGDEIEMYGMKWKRGGALLMLIVHQAHHRGQMTVLMRQAGLQVPGTLGPARQEWAQWGMPAQK